MHDEQVRANKAKDKQSHDWGYELRQWTGHRVLLYT